MLIYIQKGGVKKLKDRIKAVRKALGLNQAAFGERVGVKGNTIGNYEIGLRNPSDAVIFSICREFNINENWLREGKGEMFLDFSEDEFSKAAASLSNDAFVRGLIIEYWKLDDDSKKLFRDFIHRLSDNMRGQE